MRNVLILFLLTSVLLAACSPAAAPQTPRISAGYRFSVYGPPWFPPADYWAETGQQIAGKFDGAQPAALWIVSQIIGEGSKFNFPGTTDQPNIYFSMEDQNEEIFQRFDEIGMKVWLQVEPGNADVEQLIHIMLKRYSQHPCVIGVGVDVEWLNSIAEPEGRQVTDEEARLWLAAARSYNKDYRLFLKHWEAEKMPPTYREGILFVDDSQMFDSLDAMVTEFAAWGKTFEGYPVAFQYGYTDDQTWWGILDDPVKTIGERILSAAPNTEGLFWVDFTLFQVFPPE